MKKTYKCPHNEFEVYGNCIEVYCRLCNSMLFSIERTNSEEFKIAKAFSKDKRKGYSTLKELTE